MSRYIPRPPGHTSPRQSRARGAYRASDQATDGFRQEGRPVEFPFCEIDRGRYPRSNRKRDLERIEEGRQ